MKCFAVWSKHLSTLITLHNIAIQMFFACIKHCPAKPILLVKERFVRWSNIQTLLTIQPNDEKFCLTSRFKLFEKQCLIALPEPKESNALQEPKQIDANKATFTQPKMDWI